MENEARDRYSDIVHTGPDTIGGRYLRSFWQPIFVASELPVGRARPLRVMSEDFTIFRSETGKAQVLAPHCPHRGTKLSTGWVEGETLRCFYHGWRFAGSGQCVEAPAEREGFASTLESVREHQAGLHSFRSISLIDARRRNASAFRFRFSQSLTSRLHRPSHANVRSTTHRFGRTMNPFA